MQSLQSGGGEIVQLYKRKGPQTEMDKYRPILLADCIGKVCSRTYRTMYTPFIAAAMRDEWSWQCGGIPGVGQSFQRLQ